MISNEKDFKVMFFHFKHKLLQDMVLPEGKSGRINQHDEPSSVFDCMFDFGLQYPQLANPNYINKTVHATCEQEDVPAIKDEKETQNTKHGKLEKADSPSPRLSPPPWFLNRP